MLFLPCLISQYICNCFVGTLLNYIEIRGIASDPWTANVKQVERFNDINSVVQPVVDAMCDSKLPVLALLVPVKILV